MPSIARVAEAMEEAKFGLRHRCELCVRANILGSPQARTRAGLLGTLWSHRRYLVAGMVLF